jgi:predicted nucleic acid-binding protein
VIYMLDTSICIHATRGRDQELLARLETFYAADLVMSAITLAELEAGVGRDPARVRERARALANLVSYIQPVPFDAPAAACFGRVQAAVYAAADRSGKQCCDAKPSLGLGQQHHAAVRRDPPAVECGGGLLALYGWKRKRQRRIVGHGGCGRPVCRRRTGVSNQILRHINRLRYIRQPLTRGVMNKTG